MLNINKALFNWMQEINARHAPIIIYMYMYM